MRRWKDVLSSDWFLVQWQISDSHISSLCLLPCCPFTSCSSKYSVILFFSPSLIRQWRCRQVKTKAFPLCVRKSCVVWQNTPGFTMWMIQFFWSCLWRTSAEQVEFSGSPPISVNYTLKSSCLLGQQKLFLPKNMQEWFNTASAEG